MATQPTTKSNNRNSKALAPKAALLFLTLLSSFISPLKADEYEGIPMFASYDKIDLGWLPQFLPYNPVIVEAGAFRGAETCRAAKIWPQGSIYAIEPNLDAFKQLGRAVDELQLNNVKIFNLALNTYNGKAYLYSCCGMQGSDPAFGYASSLLPLTRDMEVYCKGPVKEVACMTLDSWCEQQKIDHIDILRLEVEGLELKVLESSPQILKKTQIIYVKTMMHPYRISMTQYDALKRFLIQSNFVLLSHRFTRGIIGHAVFLSRELFDSYFKKSLGIYLEQ